MTSKELLSEVLGYEVLAYNGIHHDYILDGVTHTGYPLNIYELAYKCKEWAIKQDKEYEVNSYLNNEGNGHCEVYESWHNNTAYGDFEYLCESDTEPEAIFKACEWIREQHDN